MYDYRKMADEERKEVLRVRKERGFPLHAPPHFKGISGEYLISTACFEHGHIFETPEDLTWLMNEALTAFEKAKLPYQAWVFLPNHYHVLLNTSDLAVVSDTLRLMHSSTATAINGKQKQRGRKVWYCYSDRFIRGEAHHWASVNYIHYNPVKHGYVTRMLDWPWSSIHEYMETHGRPTMEQLWRDYPIKNYGKGWDW